MTDNISQNSKAEDNLSSWEIENIDGEVNIVNAKKLDGNIVKLEFIAKETERKTRDALHITLDHDIIGLPELADADEVVASILWKLRDSKIISVKPLNADRKFLMRDTQGVPLIPNCGIAFRGFEMISYRSDRSGILINLCRCEKATCMISSDSFLPTITLGSRRLSDDEVFGMYGGPVDDKEFTYDHLKEGQPPRTFPRKSRPEYENFDDEETPVASTAHAPWNAWMQPDRLIIEDVDSLNLKDLKNNVTDDHLLESDDEDAAESENLDPAHQLKMLFRDLFSQLLTEPLPEEQYELDHLFTQDTSTFNQCIHNLSDQARTVQEMLKKALITARRSRTKTAIISERELSLNEIELLMAPANERAAKIAELIDFIPGSSSIGNSKNPKPKAEPDRQTIKPASQETKIEDSGNNKNSKADESRRQNAELPNPEKNGPDKRRARSIKQEPVSADPKKPIASKANESGEQNIKLPIPKKPDRSQVIATPAPPKNRTRPTSSGQLTTGEFEEALKKAEKDDAIIKDDTPTSQPENIDKKAEEAEKKPRFYPKKAYFEIFSEIISLEFPSSDAEIKAFIEANVDTVIARAAKLLDQADTARMTLYDYLRKARVSKHKAVEIGGKMITLDQIEKMLSPANEHSAECQKILSASRLEQQKVKLQSS